jgi:hypothetical protein
LGQSVWASDVNSDRDAYQSEGWAEALRFSRYELTTLMARLMWNGKRMVLAVGFDVGVPGL